MRIVMNAYEKMALESVRAWENREPGAVETALAGALHNTSGALQKLLGSAGVPAVLEEALSGMLSLLNDAAAATVREEAIHEAFRAAGHAVKRPEDIFRLPLEAVDRTMGCLGVKYKTLAAAQGGLEGAGSAGGPCVGAAAAVAGVPLLTAWSLRAACEYAVYHGFDIRKDSERLYALRVLNAASILKMGPKLAFLAELNKIAHELAVRKTWETLSQNTFARTAVSMGKAFGLRVTKAKLAQAVPVAGIVIGAGFNAWFMSEVCETASMLYRKRFLARAFDDPDLLLPG